MLLKQFNVLYKSFMKFGRFECQAYMYNVKAMVRSLNAKISQNTLSTTIVDTKGS